MILTITRDDLRPESRGKVVEELTIADLPNSLQNLVALVGKASYREDNGINHPGYFMPGRMMAESDTPSPLQYPASAIIQVYCEAPEGSTLNGNPLMHETPLLQIGRGKDSTIVFGVIVPHNEILSALAKCES